MAQHWYVRGPAGEEGPIAANELRKWAAAGRLNPSDRVSLDRRRWASADRVKGLSFPPARVSTPAALADPTATPRTDVQPIVAPDVVPGYEIVSALGCGGFGTVYRARQLQLDREVALKTIRLGDKPSEELVRRSTQEAHALARLQHPNIVAVYDFGLRGGQAYLAMELLQGEDLSQRLTRDGPVDERTAWVIARQVAAALAHAAGQGIIHRDVKPANLFLVPRPTGFDLPDDLPMVKVTDFGLALTRQAGTVTDRLTRAGTYIGTPVYMAPEQFGNLEVDHRVDIYALGVTVFEALTGRTPFQAQSVWDLMVQKMETDLAPGLSVSSESASLLADMTAREPERRVADYATLIARIDRLPCLRGLPLQTVAAARPRLRRTRTKPPTAWLVFGVALAGAALGVGVSLALAWPGGPEGAAGPAPALTAAGPGEALFDGKTLAGWRFQQGAGLEKDAEGAPVCSIFSSGVRPYPAVDHFRLLVSLDLHKAQSADVALLPLGPAGPAAAGYVLRVTRAGVTLEARDGRGSARPVGATVAYSENREGQVPYREVSLSRAGDRWEVGFDGRPVAAFRLPGVPVVNEVRVTAKGGPLRVESALFERLRPQE